MAETAHPVDDRVVLAATVAAGSLVAQQVAGKAVRDAFFLTHFAVETLPAVLMGSAALSAVAVFAFSRLVARHGPARFVPAAVVAGSGGLVAEWGLSLRYPGLAALAVYAHMAVFGATLVSAFWSLVNERFDPYTARRVVGRIGMGASLGGIAGGAMAWASSGRVAVASMLLFLAALNLLGLPALLFLRAGARATSSRRPEPLAGSGLGIVRGSPYLRDLALLVGLGALAAAALDYVLNAQAADAFHKGAGLIAFFSLFHGGVALVSLGVQIFGVRRALETLGLAGTAAMKPAAVGIGGLVGLLAPQLWSAALARGLEAVLHNSVYRSGYELLFTPLPEETKRPTKAIVDVGFDRLGTLAGGAVAFLAVAVAPSLAGRTLFAVAVAAALAGLALCRRVHGGYVLALEESLRSGALSLDPADIHDSTTRLTFARTSLVLDRETLLRQIHALRSESGLGVPAASLGAGVPVADAGQGADDLLAAAAALRSGGAEEIRRVLSQDLDPALVGWAIPLLARNDVFLEVLQALRRAAPRATGQLADALLDQSQPQTVRRRLPRVLRASATQRSADGLLLGLSDAQFEVRYECGAALARIAERNPGLSLPAEVAYAAAVAELRAGAGLAEEARQRRLDHVFHLLALVLEREPVRLAQAALRSDNELRGTALEYLENVLPGHVRDTLWSVLGVPAPTRRSSRRSQDLVSELLRLADRAGLRGVARKASDPEP